MASFIACFTDRSHATMACQALAEANPDMKIALHLPADDPGKQGGDDLLSRLRSVVVELVGVEAGSTRALHDGCAAKVIVSDVGESYADTVKDLLLAHGADRIEDLNAVE